MRFVCDSCRAQYMISDDKVGAKGVKVRCKKCSHVILVKKESAAAAPPAPSPKPAEMGSMDDVSPPTQVMMNPLADASPGATIAGMPAQSGGAPFDDGPRGGGSSGGNPNSTMRADSSFFSNMADDEIGAAFDSVLGEGEPESPTMHSPVGGGDDLNLGLDDDADRTGSASSSLDDRLSTRVLDPETMKKLADEAGVSLEGLGSDNAGKKEDSHEWYVAIDEKQVGPLTPEKVKDRWDRGEIGPDSLCWRAGMGDWSPVSEVQELAAHLAPQPRKPVVVAAAAMAQGSGAFMQDTGMAAAGSGNRDSHMVMGGDPDVGGWKPSAASALASLVQDEIKALTSPKSAPRDADLPAQAMAAQSLLNIPPAGGFGGGNPPAAGTFGQHAGATAPASAVQMPASMQHVSSPPAGAPMADPYASYPSSPPGYGYPPAPTAQPAQNRSVIVLGGGVVILLLLLVALVSWMLGRSGNENNMARNDAAPAMQQPSAQTPPPAAVAEAPKQAAPAAAAPEPAAAKNEPTAVAEAPKGESASSKVDTAAAREARAERAEAAAERRRERAADARDAREARAAESKPEPVASAKNVPSGGDDEFCKEFGCDDAKPSGGSKKPAAAARQSSPSVYVPPPVGSAQIPDTLGQSDIMSVVLANKPAIVQCGAEQKKKEPGLSGRLVMRWTVLTTGKAANVSVRSEEFRNTYIAGCINGLIKTWKFPRHRTQGDPVDFPFTF